MIGHLVRRVVLILLGYGLAVLASGAVVTAAFLIAQFVSSSTGQTDVHNLPGVFALISMLIAIYAALPAAAAVLLGEIRAIRSKLYYMITGCLIGTALPPFVQIEWWYVPVGFFFGFVAGLIYWRIAGRNAGYSSSR